MPRLARLDAPGGIERRKIFRDNRDRENFLERLGKLLLETKTWGMGTPLNNSVDVKRGWVLKKGLWNFRDVGSYGA
jgi:hypothetical protein